MVGRFYEPDEKICIIFDNVNYDKLREIPEFSKRHDNAANLGPLANEFHYHDIPLAREWADTFEEGIKAYGFSEEKTHRHKTPKPHDTFLDKEWKCKYSFGKEMIKKCEVSNSK